MHKIFFIDYKLFLIIREGEVDGREYHFRQREDFEKMIENDEFIEHACYNNNFYGTELAEVERAASAGKICILEIEMIGSKNVYQKHPDWNFVFIMPPNFDAIRER